MTVYRHAYKMELIRTSESFKPGLKYTAFVSFCVSKWLEIKLYILFFFDTFFQILIVCVVFFLFERVDVGSMSEVPHKGALGIFFMYISKLIHSYS